MLDAPLLDWVDTTVVETPVPFTGSADVVLCRRIQQDESRWRDFGRPAFTCGAATWRMRDVTLLPVPGWVFKDGRVVDPLRRGGYPGDVGAAIERMAQPHRSLNGRPCFAAVNRFAGNYFHIIAEIVPAVAAYAADPDFRDGALLCAPGEAGHLLRQALGLAGIQVAGMVAVAPATPLDVPDLSVCTLLNEYERPSLFARSVYDSMIAGAGTASGETNPAMIYVSRLDSVNRPLRNEEALIAMLGRYGIEPVLLSGLPLDRQVRLFRDARLIIGAHGAGLCNVVFCRAGAVLYEFLPAHYLNSCISRMTQLRGAHYWCDVFETEPSEGRWRHQVGWSVDVDAVERRLIEILVTHGRYEQTFNTGSA